MKAKSLGYWTATAILVMTLLSGGAAQVARQPDTLAGILKLGYPEYFVVLLGIWKILGSVALLVPRFPLVKEWAYAGAFFEMTGAAISHAACGDLGAGAFHVIVPLAFVVLIVASWALRPPGRRVAARPSGERDEAR